MWNHFWSHPNMDENKPETSLPCASSSGRVSMFRESHVGFSHSCSLVFADSTHKGSRNLWIFSLTLEMIRAPICSTLIVHQLGINWYTFRWFQPLRGRFCFEIIVQDKIYSYQRREKRAASKNIWPLIHLWWKCVVRSLKTKAKHMESNRKSKTELLEWWAEQSLLCTHDASIQPWSSGDTAAGDGDEFHSCQWPTDHPKTKRMKNEKTITIVLVEDLDISPLLPHT